MQVYIIHSNSFLDKETALVLEDIVANTIPIIKQDKDSLSLAVKIDDYQPSTYSREEFEKIALDLLGQDHVELILLK